MQDRQCPSPRVAPVGPTEHSRTPTRAYLDYQRATFAALRGSHGVSRGTAGGAGAGPCCWQGPSVFNQRRRQSRHQRAQRGRVRGSGSRPTAPGGVLLAPVAVAVPAGRLGVAPLPVDQHGAARAAVTASCLCSLFPGNTRGTPGTPFAQGIGGALSCGHHAYNCHPLCSLRGEGCEGLLDYPSRRLGAQRRSQGVIRGLGDTAKGRL